MSELERVLASRVRSRIETDDRDLMAAVWETAWSNDDGVELLQYVNGEPWCVVRLDCRKAMRMLADESVDAVVCDPPYELGFMGKKWDASGIAYDVAMWRCMLRILKPGGHLLAFGGTRTSHRMVCAIEDAGFEIRDGLARFYDSSPAAAAFIDSLTDSQRLLLREVLGGPTALSWVYGSGFPKSLDVSKAIDRAAGIWRGRCGAVTIEEQPAKGTEYERTDKGEPVTDLARQWDGYGTALKPAHEPICLARKPLTGTVAANVTEHGTGVLNVDGCRVAAAGRPLIDGSGNGPSVGCYGDGLHGSRAIGTTDLGRWPPNVLLDDEAAAMVDEQSGERPGMSGGGAHRSDYPGGMFGGIDCEHTARGDTGGASRFFPRFSYTPKTSTAEREAGLDGFDAVAPTEVTGRKVGSAGQANPRAGMTGSRGRRNTHPTVKPVDLMRWLVRLVTPPDGLVLDPFCGSGTTGMACALEGFRFLGIELGEHNAEIARARIRYAEQRRGRPLIAEKAAPVDKRQLGLFGGNDG